MSQMTWQGSRKLINVSKAIAFSSLYVAEHRLRTMSKWWTSMVTFGIGNPLLLLLSVGIGIGALVDKNSGGIDGVSYLTFLAPALLSTAAIQATMDECMFPVMQGFSWDRTFFAMNSTQIGGRAIVTGVLLSAGARNLFTVVLFEAVLVVFGAVPLASIPVLTVSSMVAGFAFGSLMLMVASFVKQDDGVFAIIGRFIVAPMFMFSGTYYPLESLPNYLQCIGWASPVWHATEIGRNLSYGHVVQPWLMFVHIGYLLLMFTVGYVISGWQFVRRLSK
ncbi:MAG: ABC transporter permease [Micrococcales bacterium]